MIWLLLINGNNRNKLQKSILPKIEKHKLKDI